jgi:SAM-dependent methyltransferase
MSVIGSLHTNLVFGRRTRILAHHLCQLIPSGARVLDVGCGDGLIDRMIMDQTGASIEGIDTLIRPSTHIPVRAFSGSVIPYADRSVDVVMFVDVLHHTSNPKILLAEAVRVGRSVLIKDHLREGFLANETLRLGNAHHNVVLPYNYLSNAEWNAAFGDIGLQVSRFDTKLHLYPAPFSWIFERGLHFIAFCTPVG